MSTNTTSTLDLTPHGRTGDLVVITSLNDHYTRRTATVLRRSASEPDKFVVRVLDGPLLTLREDEFEDAATAWERPPMLLAV